MSETVRGVISAVGFVLGSFVLALLSRRILRTVLRSVYKKTKSELDDVVVRALERPLMLAVLLAGLYGAALAIVHLDAWGFSAARSAEYVGKTSQAFKAAFRVVMAFGVLKLLNAISLWYVRSLDSRGAVHQIGVLRKIVNFGVWALVIVLVLGQLGYKVSALLATLGVAGLAVALALQDTLANVFAGFYIVADRSIKVGDYVKLDSGEEGFVEDVSWRNTRIRLWANNMVIVPNSKLIQSIVTNYDLPQQQLSVYVWCAISYNSDLDHVERVTIEVAREVLSDVPGGVRDYEPVMRYKEFGDSNITFVVVLRSKDAASQYLLQHEFIKRLHRRYRDEGIEISYPVRVIMSAGAGKNIASA